MKKTLLLFCVFISLNAQITLDFLKSKPRGIARDFYIWQFLQNPQNATQDSLEAYRLIFRENDKLDRLLIQRVPHSLLPKKLKCKTLSFEKLKNEDAECISFGLKLSTIPSLSNKDIKAISAKLSQEYPILAQEVEILGSKTPLLKAIQSQDPQVFSEIFYGLNLEQRLDIFNQKISPKSLAKLANQNHPNFNKMLQYVLISEHFNRFKSSILDSNITQVDKNLLLLLGAMQAKHNRIKKAQNYFRLILKDNKPSLARDKALLWLYLTSKNKNFLKQLSQSNNLNLYTIYANQKLHTKPAYSIISQMPDLKEGKARFDITNPFQWQILRENLIKIQSKEKLLNFINQSLSYQDTAPHKAAILLRLQGYRENYFLMPYAQNLSWQSKHQKAFAFAIARQESRLIPALVSTSYALGMMQIMPFNLDPIAKALGKKGATLDDLFHPEIALEFGRYYLKELEDEFKHPLFVAYAYNGGPGFWRRTLAKNTLFRANNPYEPWLSLELIPYEESKNYGPRVLTNYIIYQGLLGNYIDLEKLLKQTLIYPNKKESQ